MIAKRFNELTTEELYRIMMARAAVFTREEHILYPDADGLDMGAVHVFETGEDGSVRAYLRMYRTEGDTVQMGRILTTDRGVGLGRALMEYAEEAAVSMLDARELYLESQLHAKGFYEKCGFDVISDVFIEVNIEHVKMRKILK